MVQNVLDEILCVLNEFFRELAALYTPYISPCCDVFYPVKFALSGHLAFRSHVQQYRFNVRVSSFHVEHQ